MEMCSLSSLSVGAAFSLASVSSKGSYVLSMSRTARWRTASEISWRSAFHDVNSLCQIWLCCCCCEVDAASKFRMPYSGPLEVLLGSKRLPTASLSVRSASSGTLLWISLSAASVLKRTTLALPPQYL